MPREEVSTFQFSCLAQEQTLFDFVLCNCCYKRILRNNPHNQTNILRLNVTLTTPKSQSFIIKSFLRGYRFKIQLTIDQRAQNTRLSCPPTLLQLYSYLLCYKICNRISHITEWIFSWNQGR